MGYVILFVIAIIFMAIAAIFKAIAEGIAALAPFRLHLSIAAATIFCHYLVYLIYVYLYFRSKKFKDIKESVREFIANCNELNQHIEDLKHSYVNIQSYDYGTGSLKDDSRFNYKRTEWANEIKNRRVHNCSAAVCKNAIDQPIKYLCKYFDIKTTEDTLSGFESVLNDFAAAEQGKVLLQNERKLVLDKIGSSIPWLIREFNKSRLIKELGFEEVDLSDLYFPIYTFQYVSAGGRSSLKSEIKLDISNLDNLISYLKDLIKFRKSVEGQRALMTSTLREKIKQRDGFACQICRLSISAEPNLLLEIDHITPLSKGGITTESNLQTLCWRCNRSKGAKILTAATES